MGRIPNKVINKKVINTLIRSYPHAKKLLTTQMLITNSPKIWNSRIFFVSLRVARWEENE